MNPLTGSPRMFTVIFLSSTFQRFNSAYDLRSLSLVTGPGVLATYGLCSISIRRWGSWLMECAGELHRRQREMLNPVFSIYHMRHLTPIFYEVAHRVSASTITLSLQCHVTRSELCSHASTGSSETV